MKPALTQLFIRAAAIVADVGGLLSPGPVVAREYGIPAVFAPDLVTNRVQNRGVATVDGCRSVDWA